MREQAPGRTASRDRSTSEVAPTEALEAEWIGEVQRASSKSAADGSRGSAQFPRGDRQRQPVRADRSARGLPDTTVRGISRWRMASLQRAGARLHQGSDQQPQGRSSGRVGEANYAESRSPRQPGHLPKHHLFLQ